MEPVSLQNNVQETGVQVDYVEKLDPWSDIITPLVSLVVNRTKELRETRLKLQRLIDQKVENVRKNPAINSEVNIRELEKLKPTKEDIENINNYLNTITKIKKSLDKEKNYKEYFTLFWTICEATDSFQDKLIYGDIDKETIDKMPMDEKALLLTSYAQKSLAMQTFLDSQNDNNN